jgi:hypothetical protein
MPITPGIDSIYVVASKAAIKNVVDAIPDVSQAIKDILNRVTKHSVYIWWGDQDLLTTDGKLVIEIPKNILKAQTYILNNYENNCYTKETLQSLLPKDTPE